VNLYRVIPPPAQSIDLTVEAERDALLAELAPPSGPWIRAIMVTTSAGDMTGQDGTSASISKGSDRALLGLHRSVVDAVVVGATTIKAEPVPLPRETPLVVVSGSGDLNGHQLLNPERGEVIVVTTSEGQAIAPKYLQGFHHRVITLPGRVPFSAEEIIDALHKHLGAATLLIEGGRVLYETFATVTDEVALAVTPPPRNEQAGIPSWWPVSTEQWRLTDLMTDDDRMLYYRYLTGYRGAPS
jgi:riboflavin biosynthesis pyrimidine reductase